MQLNKTTDYAIRMIIYLAKENKMITTEELVEHICVTENYTRKILRKLAKGGIVNLKSGINGGVILKKTPCEISLYDIITIMEVTTKINRCLEKDKKCDLACEKTCPIRRFYIQLQETIEKEFGNMTIEKLLLSDEG